MADVKIFIGILLYIGLVTIIINSVQAQQFTGIQGFYDFQEYNYYSDLTISNLTLKDLNIESIYGNWELSENKGLHATNLILTNPLYFLPIIGGTANYEAACRFGSIVPANNTYSEFYNVTGINQNPGNKNMLLMIDFDTRALLNIVADSFEWYLVTDNNELWIQSGRKTVWGVTYKDLGDNIDDIYGTMFTRNYDTGYRFTANQYDYNIGYTVTYNGYKNAVITLYVNSIMVFSQNIPLTFVDIDFATQYTTLNGRQTLIKTNNYDFGVLATSQIISGKQIDRGFDFWSLFDTIFSICFFQVSTTLVPSFMQFILFGIYDLALMYIFACLVRGV